MYKSVKKLFKNIISIIILFTLFTSITLGLLRFINPPTTAFIQQSVTNSLESVLKKDEYLQKWVPLKSISKEVIFAVIASEDQRFIEHYGFDSVEIEKAVEEKLDGGKVRGASTITQQVAKNLFLFPTKSFLRKGFEIFYSILIEAIWNKKRIMEVYLNIAEFGENIYGVEAAAGFYFNKPSQFLSKNEAAELVSILPNPIKYNIKKKSEYLIKRIERIKSEMSKLDKEEIKKAIQ